MEYTAKTTRAIAKYGEATCIRIYQLNRTHGEGPSSILNGYRFAYNFRTVGQIDAAIDAGEEVVSSAVARVSLQDK